MEKYYSPDFWVQLALIVVVGVILLFILLRTLRIIAKRVNLTLIAFRPFIFAIRWAGILLITGLVLREFGIDLMGTLLAALGLVAIGVVAVWSMLSHITATFLLILLKPFRVGDTIEFPGEEVRGMLIDLNLFFAILKDENDNEYIIPTNAFFQKTTRRKLGEGKIELSDQFDESCPYKPEKS
jgi:small-conductance mechanosensitive channel